MTNVIWKMENGKWKMEDDYNSTLFRRRLSLHPVFTRALAKRIHRINLHIRPNLSRPTGPDHTDSLDLRFIAQSKMDSRVACREIAAVGVGAAPERIRV